MTDLVDLLIKHNPLLGHGPRAHGIGVTADIRTPARRPRARWDVDAPRVHLGHAGRTS